MSSLHLAYFGTPDFSAHLLERIIQEMRDRVTVDLVVTRPDQPVGRKQLITPSAVKTTAQKYQIPVWQEQVKSPNDGNLIATMKKHQIDLSILFAYGAIIPKSILHTPRYGFWNIHPSLLPLFRGASPLAYAIMTGTTKTGVSLMQMDELMDHGPLLNQVAMDIPPHARRGELENAASDLGFTTIQKKIAGFGKGSADPLTTPLFLQTTPPPAPQNEAGATYTKLLRKNDGFIPFSVLCDVVKANKLISAYFPQVMEQYFESIYQDESWKAQFSDTRQVIYDYFRALSPWPGIWTECPIKNMSVRLKILDLSYDGTIFLIKKVQLAGKRPVDFVQFNREYALF